jgi:hypothetical protein
MVKGSLGALKSATSLAIFSLIETEKNMVFVIGRAGFSAFEIEW